MFYQLSTPQKIAYLTAAACIVMLCGSLIYAAITGQVNLSTAF